MLTPFCYVIEGKLMRNPGQRIGLEVLLIFTMFLSVYLITASDAGWHNDGLVRMYVARNLLEHGDPILREAEQDQVDQLWAVTGREGRLYSFYGIGHSLLIIPTQIATDLTRDIFGSRPNQYVPEMDRFWLGMIAPVMSAMVGAAVYSVIRQMDFSRSSALCTAAVIGLGTLIWPHARDLHDNLVETAFVMVSLALIVTYNRTEQVPFLVGAGALFGFAFITRTSAVFAFPGLMLVLLMPPLHDRGFEPRLLLRIVWFGLGSLIFAWIYPAYNFWRFGSPFETGYTEMFARDSPAPGQPLLPGLATWLISPWHGLLVFTPLVLLIPVLAKRFMAHRMGKWVLLGGGFALASVTLFYSTYRGLGKWAYGPGYLMIGIPFFLLGIAPLFEYWRVLPSWQRLSGVLLTSLNILVSLPGVFLPVAYAALLIGKLVPVKGGDDLSWIPASHSPIVLMGRQSLRALGNVFSGRAAALETIPDPSTWLDTYVGLNAPDWWWLLAYYRGFEPALIIPVILLGVAGAALYGRHQLGGQVMLGVRDMEPID
ncbi:MAG: hypothetical protein ACFB51_07485 [Anaerolineae bacterium]